MQIFIRAISTLALSIGAVGATVTIVFESDGWGDANTANGMADNEMPWGFVINTSGGTFDGSESATLSRELIGLSIPELGEPSTPVPIGSGQYAFVRAISNSQGDATVSGYFDQVVFSLGVAGVDTGDAVGLIWFNANTQVVTANSTFGYQNLNKVLPTDGNVETSGYGGTPTTMQFQTIPEPGVLGLSGLAALAFLRRRRR